MWRRHANPRSGWTRVPTGAVLVYAVYRRDVRLLVASLVWTAINPFLFSPPETEDAWMTRAVRAERWWIYEEGNATVGPDYPNMVNAVGGSRLPVRAVRRLATPTGRGRHRRPRLRLPEALVAPRAGPALRRGDRMRGRASPANGGR